MKRSLTKKERVKKQSDFERLFKSSCKLSCQNGRLLFCTNDFAFSRFGVAVVKKLGNAVARNRAKRWVRESFRSTKRSIKPGYDIVFVVYPGENTHKERNDQLISLLKQSNLIKNLEP